MAASLYLDAGNSRLKWLLVEETGEVSRGVCEYGKPGLLYGTSLEARSLQSVVISTVKGEGLERQLTTEVKALYQLEPTFIRVQRELLGVKAAYRELSRLGVDRWLAMLAAHARDLSPVVVIDAGTAITADFLDGHGRHLGGLIVPGVQTMARALFANTGSVHVESLTLPQTWAPGCDTLACVEMGVAASLQGLVDQIRRWASGQYPQSRYILTGGDAGVLGQWLSAAEMAPDLVFEGMRLIEPLLPSVTPGGP